MRGNQELNAIEGIEEIRKAASYAAGWATTLDQHLQQLVADYRNGDVSPIIQAARGRRLAPGFESAMARLIIAAADDFEGITTAKQAAVLAGPPDPYADLPVAGPADPTGLLAGSGGSSRAEPSAPADAQHG